MPKRMLCSIDDFYIPPSKNHIPPHIRAIHDKTISILFNGANRKNNNYDKNEIKRKLPNIEKHCVKTMKQLFINQNGTLSCKGSLKTPVLEVCILCSTKLSDYALHCSYCDIVQCSSCAIICCLCNLPTCDNCSIYSYDQDKTLCLSCYR